jgi:hypothetical protein
MQIQCMKDGVYLNEILLASELEESAHIMEDKNITSKKFFPFKFLDSFSISFTYYKLELKWKIPKNIDLNLELPF